MRKTQLTLADVDQLQQLVDQGRRADAYYLYYQWTGSNEALLQAQISSYSGAEGGVALIANMYAKSAVPDKYPATIDSFSRRIAEDFLRIVRDNVQQGGTGILDDETILNTAQQSWVTLDIGNFFPGNLLRGFSLESV